MFTLFQIFGHLAFVKKQNIFGHLAFVKKQKRFLFLDKGQVAENLKQSKHSVLVKNSTL